MQKSTLMVVATIDGFSEFSYIYGGGFKTSINLKMLMTKILRTGVVSDRD